MATTSLELHSKYKWGEEISANEMYSMVENHRRTLRPVDVTEKIEHAVYNPNASIEGRPRGVRLYLNDEGSRFQDYLLLDHAWGQLCSRIAPAPYFKANVEAMPAGLQFQVVNHFIQQVAKTDKLKDRMRLFRTLNPKDEHFIRGILTHQFATVDDADILNDLRQVPEIETARVREICVGETFSHFKLIFPEIKFDIAKNDPVVRSIVIRNSEVGCARVSIYGAIERLICTNGMTSSKSTGGIDFVHRGDRHAKLKLIRYGVADALNKTDVLVEGFRKSLTTTIDEPLKEFERSQERFKWSDELTEKIQNQFVQEGGDIERPSAVYPFVNAITYIARDFSGEKRFDLERNAGDFLAVHVRRN